MKDQKFKLATNPTVKRAEVVFIGELNGKAVQLDRDFDDERGVWIGCQWYPLTVKDYRELRALVGL
jgi:hypothetical protein